MPDPSLTRTFLFRGRTKDTVAECIPELFRGSMPCPPSQTTPCLRPRSRASGRRRTRGTLGEDSEDEQPDLPQVHNADVRLHLWRPASVSSRDRPQFNQRDSINKMVIRNSTKEARRSVSWCALHELPPPSSRNDAPRYTPVCRPDLGGSVAQMAATSPPVAGPPSCVSGCQLAWVVTQKGNESTWVLRRRETHKSSRPTYQTVSTSRVIGRAACPQKSEWPCQYFDSLGVAQRSMLCNLSYISGGAADMLTGYQGTDNKSAT